VHNVSQLLVPLGPLAFVVQEKFGLLRFCLRALLVDFAFFLIKDFALFFELLLVLRDLLVSLPLNIIQLLAKSLSLVLQLFKFLAKIALLRHLVSAGQFKTFCKCCLLPFQLPHFLVKFVVCILMSFLRLLQPLVELILH
jgi:hypothetical protein